MTTVSGFSPYNENAREKKIKIKSLPKTARAGHWGARRAPPGKAKPVGTRCLRRSWAEPRRLSSARRRLLPLGSTIPSKAGGANVSPLETATCHFMPAASLRALAAVNEQQASDHLNGISRVSNVSCQRKNKHVGLRHQSAQTEKLSRVEVPCVSKLGTKTSIKKAP